MTITPLSSRELTQDVTRAKKAARNGPVFITDRGRAGSVDAAELFISAITVMELQLGVMAIERKVASQGAAQRAWLEQQVLPEFARERCRSIAPWHNAVRACLCQTGAASGMHSLRQRRWCMA